MLAACLFRDSFSALHGGSHIGVCLVPGDVNRPFSSPWEPLFNVSLSAYQNCTKPGWGKESKKGWGEGAKEREEKSNNAISTGSLNDATLTTIWHFDKRGPDIVSSKSGLFFYYILFCRREDKTPPPSFLVNFQSHFVTVLLFPLCWPAYLDKGDQPSLLLRFCSYLL